MKIIVLALMMSASVVHAVDVKGLRGPRSPYKCGVIVGRRVLTAATEGKPYAYIPAACANNTFNLAAHVPLDSVRGEDGYEVWLDGVRLVKELRIRGVPTPLSPDVMRRLCDAESFRRRFSATHKGCMQELAHYKARLDSAD